MEIYAFNRREDDNLQYAEKELMTSIDKTYDLYHLLLLLVLDIADIAEEKIEQARNKKMPTWEDLNPNCRFVENAVVKMLREHEALNKYVSKNHLSWSDTHIPRSIYSDLIDWDAYSLYMNSPVSDFSGDKKFIVQMVTELFPNSDELESCLEEMNIYWNDDMEYVTVMVGKTIQQFSLSKGAAQDLKPLFKNEEDEEFVKVLLRKSILNDEKYTQLIEKHTTYWEIDRIALMDMLVMKMAISEIVEFDDIPVKVTLNEYIEIAKYYCTEKSGTFVNGILDKIVRDMKESGMLNKSGRGLIDESIR